jgi:hypothetical protein
MVAMFHDANPNARTAPFRLAMDWGEGSPQTAGTVVPSGTSFRVDSSHTSADSLPAGKPGSDVAGPQNGRHPEGGISAGLILTRGPLVKIARER